MENKKRFLIICIVLFAAITVVLTVLFWPLIKNLGNPEYRMRFSNWVAGMGWKGVIVLFGLEVLQIVIAIIPGGPVELISGAAYGAWGGAGICVAGCVVATVMVFLLVKQFGLPLIIRFFGRNVLDSWSFLTDSKRTSRLVFILFLIPGMPKDTLTYLAPLTRLSLLRFTAISVFARIPAILSSTIMGDAVIGGNWVMFLLIFAVTALAGLLGIQFKDRIVNFFSSKKKTFLI